MACELYRPHGSRGYFGQYASSAGSRRYPGGYYWPVYYAQPYDSAPIAYDYRPPSLKSLHRSLYGREYGSLSEYGYPTTYGYRKGLPEILPRKYDISSTYSRNYCPRYSKHRWY